MGGSFFCDEIIKAWMPIDPEAAMAWAYRLNHAPEYQYLVKDLKPAKRPYEIWLNALRLWCKTDPVAAVGWVEKISPVHDSIHKAIVVREFGRKNPQDALLWALQNIPDWKNSHQGTISGVLEHWAKVDPEMATAWMEENTPKDTTPYIRVASIWALKDPKAALTWADKYPHLREKIHHKIVRSCWVHGNWDAPAAIQWADQLPSFKTPLLFTISRTWASKDPEAAYAFLTTLPAGKAYNNAVHHIAKDLAVRDLKKAKAWAASLPHKETNFALVVKTIYDRWHGTLRLQRRIAWKQKDRKKEIREEFGKAKAWYQNMLARDSH